MVEEASLAEVTSGLVPVGEGWFLVNVADAAWITNEAFGARCVFEAAGPLLRGRSDLTGQRFAELGITLQVLEPGKPSGLYHAESSQEDFLVLAGECLLLIEGEERRLRACDFVHCAPGTAHCFVGVGPSPCVVLMVGARSSEGTIVYPESDLARSNGASVEAETTSPHAAYEPFPDWMPGRPNAAGLPWATR
jgi:uncharacterized cupin superfamily protein